MRREGLPFLITDDIREDPNIERSRNPDGTVSHSHHRGMTGGLGDFDYVRGRGNAESLDFRPFYMPERIELSKERELVRHANFCGLEDVFEIHGKNREIHISGILLQDELSDWDDVVDWNQEAVIVTPGLPDSMKIRVVKGDREGPVSYDPRNEQYQWKYSLDVVSTGESEQRHIARYNEGIISDGVGGTGPERDGSEINDGNVPDNIN